MSESEWSQEETEAMVENLANVRRLCVEAADRLEEMDTAWVIAWYNLTDEGRKRTLRQCNQVGLPNGFVLQAIFAGNKYKAEANKDK